jgi:hypothetical protein
MASTYLSRTPASSVVAVLLALFLVGLKEDQNYKFQVVISQCIWGGKYCF